MGVPTQGEVFSQLLEYMRKAQEASATLSHLAGLNDDKRVAMGWFAISENFKHQIKVVTQIAMGKMQ